MLRPPLLLALLPLTAVAQDLVPNGDFEAYTLCPDYVSQIDRATGWSRPTEGTSDYFNACLAAPFSMSVPANQFGTQEARSGNGYAGFYSFYETGPFSTPGDDDREYVTYPLSSELIAGNTYAITFHVSLSDVSKYAVNELGALLSREIPTRADELPIALQPQVTHGATTWLDEKEGWTRITGCVVADSAYRYITIGNFRDGATTAWLEVPTDYPLTYFSYYYVDDVSVEPLVAPDLGPDISACGTVILAVVDPVPTSTYTWSNGSSGPSTTVNEPGIHVVQRTDGDCTVTDTIVVSILGPVPIDLPADTTLDLCKEPLLLALSAPPAGASYSWSTGATGASLLIDDPGVYTVQAEAPGHCPSSASTLVIDLCRSDPYAPSAFTPNGDGINDLWIPIWRSHEGTACRYAIHDRWGRMVHAGDLLTAWNGSIGGAPAPVGIYTYTIETDPAQERTSQRSGHIMLIR